MAVKEVSNEEIRAFMMPRPPLGATVLWYSNKGREPEIAHVFRTSHRNVHLVTATRGVKEAVRHIDDPKLRMNAEQREMGMWDFTEEYKQRLALKDLMQSQIDDLKRQIGALITGSPRSVVEVTSDPTSEPSPALPSKPFQAVVESPSKVEPPSNPVVSDHRPVEVATPASGDFSLDVQDDTPRETEYSRLVKLAKQMGVSTVDGFGKGRLSTEELRKRIMNTDPTNA